MDDALNELTAAAILAALGHETRLRVFRLLVRAGPDGMCVGEVRERTGIAASTLAHHLGFLVQAGLVNQEKRGREVLCRAEFDAMHAVVAFLTDKCCAGFPDSERTCS